MIVVWCLLNGGKHYAERKAALDALVEWHRATPSYWTLHEICGVWELLWHRWGLEVRQLVRELVRMTGVEHPRLSDIKRASTAPLLDGTRRSWWPTVFQVSHPDELVQREYMPTRQRRIQKQINNLAPTGGLNISGKHVGGADPVGGTRASPANAAYPMGKELTADEIKTAVRNTPKFKVGMPDEQGWCWHAASAAGCSLGNTCALHHGVFQGPIHVCVEMVLARLGGRKEDGLAAVRRTSP